MATTSGPITSCLKRIGCVPGAEERLAELIQDRLRAITRKALRCKRRSPLWQTDGFVDQVLMELLNKVRSQKQANSDYLLRMATTLIRHRVIDAARQEYCTLMRGGGKTVSLNEIDVAQVDDFDPATIIAVDEAMRLFESSHPQASLVFGMHVFMRLTQQEIANELGISVDAVRYSLQKARMLLEREFRGFAEQYVTFEVFLASLRMFWSSKRLGLEDDERL